MNDKLRFLSIIWLTLLFAWFAATIDAQDCDHPSNIDRFSHVRVLPPTELKITFFDGKRLDYVLQDNRQTIVGSFEVNEKSIVDKDFARDYRKGKWWVIYCDKDLMVYRIDRYEPK